jgi:hypothetical protein
MDSPASNRMTKPAASPAATIGGRSTAGRNLARIRWPLRDPAFVRP